MFALQWSLSLYLWTLPIQAVFRAMEFEIWTIMDYVKLATGHCVSGTQKCLINK